MAEDNHQDQKPILVPQEDTEKTSKKEGHTIPVQMF